MKKSLQKLLIISLIVIILVGITTPVTSMIDVDFPIYEASLAYATSPIYATSSIDAVSPIDISSPGNIVSPATVKSDFHLGYQLGDGAPLGPNPPESFTPTNPNYPNDQDDQSSPEVIFPDYITLNPLTGLPMNPHLTWQRPIAVSVSNATPALPMNGISQADIVIEMLVESGVSRMLALYQDIGSAGVIGSIRSARHYTACIAESFGAILVSAGGSPQAYDHIRSRRIAHIDETAGRHSQMFRRDVNRISGRTVGRYHSAITTGELASRWLPEFNVRLERTTDRFSSLFFVDDGTPENGESAVEVVVRFTRQNHSTFTFNYESGTYTMRQSQGQFIDANDSSQPQFTNLLILRTSVSTIPGDIYGRLNIGTVGRGSGYFVCGGRFIEISWYRPDATLPFIFAHRDGTLLTLGRGNTYIAIIPDNMSVSFE